MEERSFDSLIRATNSTSRRGSMMTLAAAGIVAALGTPFMAAVRGVDAEKKRGKKKHKGNKRPQVQPAPQECPPPPADRCPGQVQPCIDSFTADCGGDQDCLEVVTCCPLLGECDFLGFLACTDRVL